ncbi:hypothetical protein ACEWY4_024221 [Coilia grayii]|uniref:Proline-rich protein 15-like n=1 Tax=Coilia grayii TaxID=363190 RepID=A0ABD1IZR5_9TELE
MADKSPWWRSFVGKRRAVARESAREAMLAQQQQQNQAQASQPQPSTETKPVDACQPATQLIHTPTTDSTAAPTDPQNQSAAEKRSNSMDDLEPTFNETTNRRNLRVSRSGRFKERKRVRVSLPPDGQQEQHTDKSLARDDTGA